MHLFPHHWYHHRQKQSGCLFRRRWGSKYEYLLYSYFNYVICEWPLRHLFFIHFCSIIRMVQLSRPSSPQGHVPILQKLNMGKAMDIHVAWCVAPGTCCTSNHSVGHNPIQCHLGHFDHPISMDSCSPNTSWILDRSVLQKYNLPRHSYLVEKHTNRGKVEWSYMQAHSVILEPAPVWGDLIT